MGALIMLDFVNALLWKKLSKSFAYFSEVATNYENRFSNPQRIFSSNFNLENVLLPKAAFD
jgi:hypothetical protein